MTGQPARSRSTIVLLVLLFLAPVVAAVFLNSRWSDFRPEASRNYGLLVQPVVPVADGLRELLPADEWVLLAMPPRCEDGCRELADLLERVDRALGRHGESLQPIIVSAQPGPMPPHVMTMGPSVELRELQQQASGSPLVLIDPLGNLMMRYPDDFDPAGVIDDLERLLRYSRFSAEASGPS